MQLFLAGHESIDCGYDLLQGFVKILRHFLCCVRLSVVVDLDNTIYVIVVS